MLSLDDTIESVRERALNSATRIDMTSARPPHIGKPLAKLVLTSVEQSLGVALPEIVRRIYSEIGDGGFGPGYGFLPMVKPLSKFDDSIVALYEVFSETDPSDPAWKWPGSLLPIVDFGCAIRACVDCDTSEVIVSDPNLYESDWT